MRAIYASDPGRGWMAWSLLVPVLGLVLVVVPTTAVSLALVHLDLVGRDDNPIGFAGLVAYLVLPFAALAVVIAGWVRVVEKRSLAAIGLSGGSPIRSFLRGHLAGLAMAIAVVAAMWTSGGVTADDGASAFRSPADLARIAILLVCFALQSSVEELVFRGWMLSAIAAKRGVATAVVLTSLVFTLLHFDVHQHWLATANVALFSLFACTWALASGHIYGVMGWHAGWNWMLGVGFALPITGLDTHVPALLARMTPTDSVYLAGGSQGPEGSVWCTLALVGGIVVTARRNAR